MELPDSRYRLRTSDCEMRIFLLNLNCPITEIQIFDNRFIKAKKHFNFLTYKSVLYILKFYTFVIQIFMISGANSVKDFSV